MSTEPTPASLPQGCLRIASLLPAATDICHELGLDDNVVGVTHECDGPTTNGPWILTASGLAHDLNQGDIHKAVQDSTLSLYPILHDRWELANPNLVLTQDLCAVCGPSSQDVCLLNPTIQTVSLSPHNLTQVGECFVQVAEACGIRERGLALQRNFSAQLQEIQNIVHRHNHPTTAPRPRVLVLEWLDPPFDGGHWIPEMIQLAGCDSAIPKTETKSKVLDWNDVRAAKPDVIIVACCGFDLTRNMRDAETCWKHFVDNTLPGCRIYAADGNQYFAKPGPKLRGGVSIVAQCAHEREGDVLRELQALPFSPQRGQGWERLPILSKEDATAICDIEDLPFSKLHDEACARGDSQYTDPSTGYLVFTELAHTKRGKCCGGGCRHCPYNHENVKDKASKIQQPAFLYRSSSNVEEEGAPIKVLFFSGGKDSFLALRALARNAEPSIVILLTTFDATSRVIAHQEVPIQDIQRQAEHLQVSLVGIPLQRAGGEDYVERLRRGLRVVEDAYKRPVSTLVFGDLHLEHIRGWRETELGNLGYQMEYPLWQVSYDELMKDLEASKVPCVISASIVDQVQIGTIFTRELYFKLLHGSAIDGFGEKGEFHSLAKVWETDRLTALGLASSM
jgi:diphthamide synthase (EF-2-diphthine--ammonia ligase)/ABC-type Fe3+-hydroxamate transport system substrate-binding protein